jgi:nucleotide-binding universal stress UspA family protein
VGKNIRKEVADMFKKILVAYDGSDSAKVALAKAGKIAKVGKAEIHVLTVGRIPEHAETVTKLQKARERAEAFYSKIVHEVGAQLKKQGLNGKTRLEFGKPGDVILNVAEELGVDLLVMGSKGRAPLTERALGTTVDKVVEHARCSVLLEARPD